MAFCWLAISPDCLYILELFVVQKNSRIIVANWILLHFELIHLQSFESLLRETHKTVNYGFIKRFIIQPSVNLCIKYYIQLEQFVKDNFFHTNMN